MPRIILHCDCNSFYASVETVLNPTLAKGPMAVCGNPDTRHGIILAKNEQAKAFGVETAETIWKAQKKCPNLTLVRASHGEYQKFSKLVNEIYFGYTDLVEPFGIDESWLDVTGSQKLFGTPKEIADKIRGEVFEKTGLTISVGVSFNKVFSKLGSDMKKPNATTLIPYENWQSIIHPLKVEAMLYVGKAAKKELASMYIETIGQLAQADVRRLEMRLGKLGKQLYDYANGIDDSPVRAYNDPTEVKSIGRGMTFTHDLTQMDEIHAATAELSDLVASKMRRYNLCCTTVSLAIKDIYFRVSSKQCAIANPTALASEVAFNANNLLNLCWDKTTPIRAITITASNLLPKSAATQQLSLFENNSQQRERRQRLESTIDVVRNRYGRECISTGAIMGSHIGLHQRKTPKKPED